MGYRLDAQNHYGYTNLGSDPRQTQLHFWPEYGNAGKSRYLGFVQDGSGRKREFYTPWYKWHEQAHVHLEPRKKTAQLFPQNWIPYQLILSKETLPNGNVILYEHQKWQDELDYPFPKLLKSITAYNHDQTQKLAEILFDYSTYNWHFSQRLDDEEKIYYKKTVWEVGGYSVKGSDNRAVTLHHSRRDRFTHPTVLHTVQTQDQTIHYNYTPDFSGRHDL